MKELIEKKEEEFSEYKIKIENDVKKREEEMKKAMEQNRNDIAEMYQDQVHLLRIDDDNQIRLKNYKQKEEKRSERGSKILET